MSLMREIVQVQRDSLPVDLRLLSVQKEIALGGLQSFMGFVAEAVHAVTQDGEKKGVLARRFAGTAAQMPLEFDEIEDPNPIVARQMTCEEKRVLFFLQSQLFVGLVAELEGFVTQAMVLVLESYPEKIGKQDLHLTIGEMLDLGLPEDFLSAAVLHSVAGVIYEKPLKQRQQLEKVLSMPEGYLSEFWPRYVEMKARRDVGLHGNWRKNRIYETKVREVGVEPPTDMYLGVTTSYFMDSLQFSKQLVQHMDCHFAQKFPRQVGSETEV